MVEKGIDMKKIRELMIFSCLFIMVLLVFPLTCLADEESETATVEGLSKPENLKVETDYNCLYISWDKVKGAMAYRVLLFKEGDSSSYRSKDEEYESTTTFWGLSEGKYYVKVCAVGESEYVAWYASDYTVSELVAVKTVATPKLLTAGAFYTSLQSYGLQASWSKVEGAQKYCVYVYNPDKYDKENDCNYASKLTTTSTSCTFTYDSNPNGKDEVGDGKWIIVVKACAKHRSGGEIWGEPAVSKVFSLKYHEIILQSVKQTSLNQVKISWDRSRGYGMDNIIYRKEKGGSYQKIKTLNGNYRSWTDTDFEYGKTYYYKIGMRFGEEMEYSNPVKIETTLKAPSFSVSSASLSSIRLSWSKAQGIDGYEIWRSSSKSGEYKRVRTIKDLSKLYWTDIKKKLDVVWYYKMRAYYIDSSGNKIYSPFSSAKSGKANVPQVTIKSIKAKNGNCAVLKWGKVSGATGYEIYMSKSKSGTYSRKLSVKSGSTLTGSVKKLVNGKTYYFKVRGIRTVNGHTYKGAFSKVVKRCIDTYGYAGEPNSSERVHYDELSRCKTQAEMKKYMTDITVKCWDINASGKKYTRYFTFPVNKYLAGTVKQIFKEIYEGKEKFPIHVAIGFGWRGDNSTSLHNYGLAIDINPDENYYYDYANKKIIYGTCFKPGKNPYSIPEYGEVENIFIKYGFERGRFTGKTDYMHFYY